MFRRNLKNNLKDEIMRDKKTLNDIFNLIEVIIDFNDKLYKRIIKKKIRLILRKNKNLLWINDQILIKRISF